ncbi:hypothetical protein AOQ84DRAFT_224897 [Glonium stellatum]|uniref:Uncharacterized protein n=1 Tax=Glonium stellatum TaxID=574774 RepID=A0A8E2EV37_9PEZI|nr:hypothetical protein AOQ84DRAFT_224897 [Glonium stellatum]
MRLRRERGFQNFTFACKICRGQGTLPLPVTIWPTTTIVFYATCYRKFVTSAELTLLAKNLETLLDAIILQSRQFRGDSSLEDTKLGMALCLASSLAMIHFKYLRFLANSFQKFVDIGSEMIAGSEAKFSTSTDLMVRLQMSSFYQIKAEVLLSAGREKEAKEAWDIMLDLGFRVLGPEITTEAMEKVGALYGNKNTSSSIRTKLTTWYEHLKGSWDLLKACSRGEKITKVDWPNKVLEARVVHNCLLRGR